MTDDFWQRVEPLISVRARLESKEYVRKPGAGRPPKPARQVLEAVVYVLGTGCQWKALPKDEVTDYALKTNADHRRRDAFVYVRQSTQRQVFENTERAPSASTHCAIVRSR